MLLRTLVITVIASLAGIAHAGIPEGVMAYYSKDYDRAVAELQPLAELGDATAEFYLGDIYSQTNFSGRNGIKAFRLLIRANAAAIHRAGEKLRLMRETGKISFMFGAYQMTDDEKAALEPLREAADKGDAIAMTRLAVAYCDEMKLGPKQANGSMSVESYPEVVEWFRKAAEAGEPHAQFNFGMMKLGRKSCSMANKSKRDVPQAKEWLRKAADQGITQAQVILAMLNKKDSGLEGADVQEGLRWLKLAVKQNDPQALDLMGQYVGQGWGTKQDNAEAVQWYRKAAELDDTDAQEMLARHYESGLGVKQDFAEAVKWRTLSATLGNSDAALTLARMYGQGRGIDRDFAQEVFWLQKAAPFNLEAMLYLSRNYETGQGVEKDSQKSIALLFSVADAGLPEGLSNLADRFNKGRSVPASKVMAYALYSAAGMRDYKTAQYLRDELAPQLTPAELEDAQQFLATWKPGVPISKTALGKKTMSQETFDQSGTGR